MPIHLPQCAGESYRPSNGTEGEMFMAEFCERCMHEGDDEKCCDILMRSMCYSKDDPEYPEEWRFDATGNPTCTAFVERIESEF